MKKLIFLLLIVAIPIFAQKSDRQIFAYDQYENRDLQISETLDAIVPRKISYQGILTKSNGQPAEERSYEVTFKLFKDSEGGQAFWEESQSIFIKGGLLSATIGGINPINNIPSSAFLEVNVEGNLLLPRQEMTSVFCSILSDTARYAVGYTRTEDLAPVAYQ